MSDTFLNKWLKEKFAGYLGAMVLSVPLLAGAALGLFAASNAAEKQQGLIPTVVSNVLSFVLYLFILRMKPTSRILFMSKRVWIVVFLVVYCGGYVAGLNAVVS